MRDIMTEKIDSVVQSDIKLGDNVRYRLAKTKFERGFAIHWSKTIFQVVKKIGNSFELSDGSVKRVQELQKVVTTEKKVETEALDAAKEKSKFKRLMTLDTRELSY